MNYYFKNRKQQEEIAVAVGFDDKQDPAPRVLATGNGVMAQKIIEIANQEEILIHKDEDLAGILSIIEQNSFIPVEVYGAIAKILSKIYTFEKEQQNASAR